jgi:peptide/nickel transport system permease protein
MAEAIRRLLGLVPVLFVGSIVLFFVLGRHPKVERGLTLPLFFRQHPVSASTAAEQAMRGAARGSAPAIQALQELGGAALPHVLPRLSELAVAERRRVADALEPVAVRMQIGSYRSGTSLDAALSASRGDVDQRLLLWERYYEDHDLDFRPISVERLVRRLSSRRSGMREADLLAVDTYALPYLVRALGRVDGPEDVERVRRLATAIARLSGESSGLPPHPSASEARALATRLRRSFDRDGAKFTELGRFESLTAHVTQTEFGLWWVQTLRELRGIDASVVFAGLATAFWGSLPLLLLAFAGALVLGPLGAGLLQLALLRRGKDTVQARLRLLLSLGCALSIPVFCLQSPDWPPLAGTLLLLSATLASTSVLSSHLAGKVDWRSGALLLRRPLARRLLSIGTRLASTLPTLLPLMAGEVFLWVACVELSSGRTGLFPWTMRALARGDLHALLALSLLSWISIALVQTLSNALLASENQRSGSW